MTASTPLAGTASLLQDLQQAVELISEEEWLVSVSVFARIFALSQCSCSSKPEPVVDINRVAHLQPVWIGGELSPIPSHNPRVPAISKNGGLRR